VTGWMGRFENANKELHIALKTKLSREFLRMTPASRAELDRRHKAALENVADKLQSSHRVAMHVRRTDKVRGEAVKVDCSVFLKAMKQSLEETNGDESKSAIEANKKRRIIIHLASDDPAVGEECQRELDKEDESFKSRVILHFRFAKARPDRVSSQYDLDDSFWNLLVDLRIMTESDTFVGSQSSNMGVLVSYLRSGASVYSVEHPTYRWEMKRNKFV